MKNATRHGGVINANSKVYYTKFADVTPLNKFLPQLRKVKKTGHNKYVACCPSHDDRNPSLSIREESDGKLLLRCFAGCSAYEITSAIGLDLSDLFPRSSEPGKPIKNPFPAVDVLRCIQTEALIVAIAASDIAKGKQLSESEKDRVMVAAGRIWRAYE